MPPSPFEPETPEERKRRKEQEAYDKAKAGWGHNPEYDSGRGC